MPETLFLITSFSYSIELILILRILFINNTVTPWNDFLFVSFFAQKPLNGYKEHKYSTYLELFPIANSAAPECKSTLRSKMAALSLTLVCMFPAWRKEMKYQ